MFCKKCGAKIIEGSKFCKECGAKITTDQNKNVDVEPKSGTENSATKTEKPKQQMKSKVKIVVVILVGVIAVAAVIFGLNLWKQRKAAKLTDDDISEIQDAFRDYVEENDAEDTFIEQEENTDEVEDEDEDIDIDLEYHKSQAYADVLTSFYYNDWDKVGLYGDDIPQSSINMEYDTYAITDIDGDGEEELIINNTGAEEIYAMASYIYSYNSSLGKAERWDDITTPEPIIFNNSYIATQDMHNNSLGMEIMPYTVMKCEDQHLIEEGYYVSSWDVSLAEEDYSGNYFPYGIDEDGDGIIYVVENYYTGETEYYDTVDYNRWVENQFGGFEDITWSTLDLTNVNALSNNYAQNYQKEISKLNTMFTTDLAYLYISGENIVDVTKDKITFIKENSDSLTYLGSKDGIQSIEYNSEDAGSIRYAGEPMKGVKLLGVRPGDTVEKAVEKLNKYGFYDAVNWGLQGYINGYTTNSYRIDIEIKDGKVSAISITQNNQYAG